MSGVRADRGIRRILVGLVASRQSRHALEVAARLAELHDAELEGLCVEDIDLLRLATLGIGQEIGPTSPQPRPIEPDQLPRRLAFDAAAGKRSMEHTADCHVIRWAFRVERSNVTAVILHAAGNVDVIALGRAGAGPPGPGRLGSTGLALTD